MICNKLVSMFYDRAKERTIADIRIGLGYTAIVLDNGRCGLAWTPRENLSDGCGLLKEAGSFTGKSASELIHLYPSHKPLEASIGLATINALANYEIRDKQQGDILEVINISPQDKIGIIGNFEPIVKEIEKITDRFMVFEKKKSDKKYVLPEEEIEKRLPSCSIVLITSTTLINKTFEPLIELIKNAGLCALLGPSTPMVPEFFSDKGIHMLSGVEVMDTDSVLKVVSEAGGMMKFKNFVKKVNIKI